MVINLNFSIEAWIKQLQIEANSEQEAINKLMEMSLADIVTDRTYVEASELKITNIDTTVEEYTLVVKVTDVEYDLDPEIMDLSVIEYLKNFLPTEYTLTLEDVAVSDDVEDLINDAIFHETNYDTKSFEFQVINKK
jgi:hypothetical protein